MKNQYHDISHDDTPAADREFYVGGGIVTALAVAIVSVVPIL